MRLKAPAAPATVCEQQDQKDHWVNGLGRFGLAHDSQARRPVIFIVFLGTKVGGTFDSARINSFAF